MAVKNVIVLGVYLLLLPRIVGLSLKGGAPDTQNDETELTRNVHLEVDGRTIDTTLIDGKHVPRVTLSVAFKNVIYKVDLLLNVHMLPSNYVEKVLSHNETVVRPKNQPEDMCYYKGSVRDVKHSSAAFSTCHRIKGFFFLNNSTYHVQPAESTSEESGGLYQIRKVIDDNLSQWICGSKDTLKELKETIEINRRSKRQIVTGSLDGQYVIELYVAADSQMMIYYNGNANDLIRSVKEIVNVANLLYQPVGFTVVLVGLEVWYSDRIIISSDSSATLSNWNKYRNTGVLPQHYNDVGFLISKQPFSNRVLGLAGIGTMCSSTNSGGIMTAIQENSAVSGAILAHEIGHTMGLLHDSDGCTCETSDVSCIMSSYASTSRPSMYFSTCSKSQLKLSIAKGFDICLKDFPIDETNHYSVCGNGILEYGEECDCGRKPNEECNKNCCDPNTCRLTGSAKCASGSCCDVGSCQPKPAGFQCRSPVGSCDLPESCDGRSALCPRDVFKHDGMTCSDDGEGAYCWSGQCRTHRSQCKELYGSSAKESDPMCYNSLNVRGSFEGNCGFTTFGSMVFTRCQPQDAMCGSLKCEAESIELVRYTNYMYQTKYSGTSKCYGPVLDYGTRVENPGMVPNGASCGAGKMCVSQKCVDVSTVIGKNPCPPCQNGVCSNEGRCQCYPGFIGPLCDQISVPGEVPGAIKPSTSTTSSTTSPTTEPTTTTTTTNPPLPSTTTTTTTTTNPPLPSTTTSTTTTNPPLPSTTTTTTTTTTTKPTTTSTTTTTKTGIPWMPLGPVNYNTILTANYAQSSTPYKDQRYTPIFIYPNGINTPLPTIFQAPMHPGDPQNPNFAPSTVMALPRVTPTRSQRTPNIFSNH